MNQKNTETENSAGEKFYDSIMVNINEDLLTSNTESIDEKRAGESDEDFELRMERYKNDFDECDSVLEMMEDGRAVKARIAKKDKHSKLFAKEEKAKDEDVKHAEDELSSFDE